jgi:hypothetical protein
MQNYFQRYSKWHILITLGIKMVITVCVFNDVYVLGMLYVVAYIFQIEFSVTTEAAYESK